MRGLTTPNVKGPEVPPHVIVLNGGSSSSKSTIARCLQAILPDPWLTFGTDTLVDAMPGSGTDIAFAADGEVTVGEDFPTLEAAWIEGIAAMAQGGRPDHRRRGLPRRRRLPAALATVPPRPGRALGGRPVRQLCRRATRSRPG